MSTKEKSHKVIQIMRFPLRRNDNFVEKKRLTLLQVAF